MTEEPTPTPPAYTEVHRWLELTIRRLVHHPAEASVRLLRGDETVVFEVVVRPKDISQVVGRKGRTVEALRHVLAAMSGRDNTRYRMEIVETVVGRPGTCAGGSSGQGEAMRLPLPR